MNGNLYMNGYTCATCGGWVTPSIGHVCWNSWGTAPAPSATEIAKEVVRLLDERAAREVTSREVGAE